MLTQLLVPVVLLILLCACVSAGQVLVVDTEKVLRSGADRVIGINLNYIRDHDANRPQARRLKEALKELGAGWLRFPGGEKSDYHLFASAPYSKAEPVSLGWYKTPEGRRMNFDEYIALARGQGAEPYLVTAYDSVARTQMSKAQFLEHAVGWVRYANLTHQYGVKYWEVGNENWHNGTAKPAEMAAIVAEFSKAMKAVDASILIGASGNNAQWWKEFLPAAAPHLDFISMSLYNTWNWKSYEHYLKHPRLELIGDVKAALKSIDEHAGEAHRARLKVIVAETNSKDYSPEPWPPTNSLGHALVTFDTLGKLLLEPRVAAAMLWNTRWMNDADALKDQFYALSAANQLCPSGRAVALWGQFVRDKLVAVSGVLDGMSAYASCSADGKQLSVWVINKGPQAIGEVTLKIQPGAEYHSIQSYCFSGQGPDDVEPLFARGKAHKLEDGVLQRLELPAVSVSVFVFAARDKGAPQQ